MLSENFSLEEFTKSSIAARAGIDNTPSQTQIACLRKLALVLEQIRAALGGPIVISSGFRCPALNLLIPGSAPNSAHTLGFAADFTIPRIAVLELCKTISHLPLKFDQIIYEYESWCHLSVDPRERGMLLTKKSNQPYVEGLVA